MYHRIASCFPIGAVMTDEKVDIGNLFDQAIDQFPELQDPSGPTDPPDDDDDHGDDGDGDSPWERGRRREKAILNGIRQFAEQYGVGPLAHMAIDARGDIMMLQKMKGPVSYVSEDGLSDEPQALARKYDPDYQGEISGRWIKLNHFVWERLLTDLGFMSRVS